MQVAVIDVLTKFMVRSEAPSDAAAAVTLLGGRSRYCLLLVPMLCRNRTPPGSGSLHLGWQQAMVARHGVPPSSVSQLMRGISDLKGQGKLMRHLLLVILDTGWIS
jgi:hypothetical protein